MFLPIVMTLVCEIDGIKTLFIRLGKLQSAQTEEITWMTDETSRSIQMSRINLDDFSMHQHIHKVVFVDIILVIWTGTFSMNRHFSKSTGQILVKLE